VLFSSYKVFLLYISDFGLYAAILCVPVAYFLLIVTLTLIYIILKKVLVGKICVREPIADHHRYQLSRLLGSSITI